jgi:L-malate glycosyltransferase
MKALIITVEYAPLESGVAVACHRIARGIARSAELHVLTCSGRDSRFASQARSLQSSVEEGVHVHRMSPYSGTLTHVPPQEIQNLCHYTKDLHSQHKFDLIHGFNLTGAGFAASFVGKTLGLPSIVSIRGNDVGRDVFDSGQLYQLVWTLQNATRVTSVAKDLLEYADTVSGCRRKSQVILNSVDAFDFYFKDVKLKLDGFVVCFCGVVRQKKGFAYLLEAFRRFADEHKATLLVVGELMAEEKGPYLRMIESHKLEKHVLITGMVPHKLVLNYLNLADVVVFPAITEGCSNALLEAMYCKKPVISSSVGAAPDIVTAKTGIIVSPHSSAELYEAIKTLRASRKRKQMGENAKSVVVGRFNKESEAEQWLSLYRKCLRS